MGGLQSIRNKFYGRKEIRVLILGLDAAGKTTILYRLKLGEIVTTIPTIGFNVETINHDRLIITAWDVGGRDKIRPLYRHYYPNTDALIYVVDSNDRERIEQSKEELESYVLRVDEVKGIPLLIMANKQDLQNAMSVSEVTDAMDLHNSCRDRKWHVQGCCATAGEGLMEGIDWLQEVVTGKAVKEAIVKPVAETAESVAKTQGVLTSFYNSITSYFVSTT